MAVAAAAMAPALLAGRAGGDAGTAPGLAPVSARASESTAGEGKASESRPDTLAIYVGAEPAAGFDPLTGWGINGTTILFQSRLLRFDKDMSLQPDLAESYEVSDDKITYTFHLRDGVKFSDGSNLTADDVAFSFLTARDNGAGKIDLTKLADARATDDRTVVFTLSEPYSSFLYLAGKLGIVPKALYDAQSYRENPAGSGPFKLLQWDKGQQVIVAPNEYYYGAQSAFRQVTLLFLDPETALANAQSGQLDVVMVQPEYATAKVPGMSLQTFETLDTRGFNLPCGKPEEKDGKQVGNAVTSDPAVRQALSIGIDRQAIIEAALNGIGTPSTTLLTSVPWANPDIVFEDGRVDEAKKILDDAGWVPGTDGIRAKDGVRAAFTIRGDSGDLQRYNIAVALAQQAAQLGLEVTARSAPWQECWDNASTDPNCWGTGDYDPAGDLVSYYASYGQYNFCQYANDAVDEHVHEALDTTDQDVTLEQWRQVQWDGSTGPEGEQGDHPYLWVATIDHTYFVRDGLDLGEQPMHPHGHGWPVAMNLNEWRWK